MPVGKIQIHLHKVCVAVRLFRWIFQFNLGWTDEKRPKVIIWRDQTYWIDWLWFSFFARRDTLAHYLKETSW